MSHKTSPPRAPSPRTGDIFRVVLLYAAFAATWILLSDKAVGLFFHDLEQVTLVSTLKGWLFVGVTSLLLFGLMGGYGSRSAEDPVPASDAGLWPRMFLVLTALVIMILTVGSIIYAFKQQKEKESARLQAIADLKAGQIADWMRERDRDGHFVQSSRFFAETYFKWRRLGDEASGEILKKRLNDYREDRFYQGVSLLDEQNELLWDSQGSGHASHEALQTAASRAVSEGRALHAGPYLDADSQPHLDLLAPLLLMEGHGRPVVILQLDLGAYLIPTLQSWPVPSESGETLLFRREGEEVLFINKHRHRHDSVPVQQVSPGGRELLVSQVFQGKLEQGSLLEGMDCCGVPVMGVARAIPGTDWFLVAKMDLAEVQDEATRDALWISLAGLLALFLVAAAFFLFKQQQELTFSTRERKIQSEKLRTLQLLDAIAESSGEAIFAKDMEGRYLLFNREAARVTGKTRDEVLGGNDFAVFPPQQAALIMANDRKVMEGNKTFTFQEDLTTADGEITFLSTKGPLHDSTGKVMGIFGISHDITDRNRAAEALKKNRNRLEKINACLLELDQDQNANIQMLTSLCGELLGGDCALYNRLEGDTLLSVGQWQTPSDFVDRDTPDGHLCHDLICRTREDILVINDLPGTSYGASDPNVRAYGLQSYFGHVVKCEGNRVGSLCVVYKTNYSPSDDDRQVLGIIASAIGNEDKRKQAEKAFRESEATLKSIFRAAPIGIGLVRERILEEANEHLCEMTGYPREELIGRSARLLYATQEEFHRVGQEKYSRMREFGTGTVVTSWRRKDGALMDVLLSSSPIDSGDLTAGVTFTALDITERKGAEDELRESRRRLSQIIEFLPDATLVIDREGRVVAWNRAMEAMTGVEAREMIGKGNYEYALPFYGARRPILIDLALHPNRELEKEYTAIQRKGDILFGEAFTPNLPAGNTHLSATASVLRDSKGKVISAIECIRDNSERSRLEERLRHSEKMEALGVLAGGVAHDLNNVLGVVVGYSELLLEKLGEGDSERSYARAIFKGGQRAAAIVQDLLTLARRGVSNREVLNLNPIVLECQDSSELAKVLSPHPDIRLLTNLDPHLLNLSGSSVHLGKMLINLVSNAAEAMGSGGAITITTGNQYLDKPVSGYDEVREGDYVVLSVSDTGEGIPAGDLKRIFEPFYTKKVMGRSGTGLGLAVVWGTVKDHLGYINVESEEGKGAVFTIYFPVAREEIAPVKLSLAEVEYAGKGERILIVDDVKEQGELARAMLTKLNYDAVSVFSGEEALEYLKQNAVDLVVLDMIMEPGMDGLDTYARILEIHPLQRAIIVSGFSETERVNKTQALGAGAYVKKPYVLEKLGLAIRKELDKPA